MPKVILKRFVNDNQRFFYYDVAKKFIGNNGTPKSINTEEGYYSETTEDILNRELETKLGNLLGKIDWSKSFIPFSKENISIIKRYFYSLITRAPSFRDYVVEKSVFLEDFQKQMQNDVVAINGMNWAEKNTKLLDDYQFTIWKNESNCPFVLPVCGAYEISLKGCNHIILPVSPNMAFVFFDCTCANPDLLSESVTTIIRSVRGTEEVIHILNWAGFQKQCSSGWGFVVSNQKDILEELSKKYKDIDDEKQRD